MVQYTQRNVVNGSYTSAAQWKQSLMTATKAMCVAAGWTTIEDAYADGTYTRWVFRAPDSSFYAIFFGLTANIDSSGTTQFNLYYTVCETYNSSTHGLARPAVFTTSTISADATDNTVGSTEITSLATLITTYGVGAIGTASTSSSTTINNYAVAVYSDGISITTDSSATSTNNAISYIGKFTSLVYNSSTNDPVPLCIVSKMRVYATTNAAPTVSDYVGVTRSALNGGKAAHIWLCYGLPWLNANITFGQTISTSSTWDLYQGGTGMAYMPYGFYRNSTADMASFGNLRGLLKHILMSQASAAAFDQTTIGGSTYQFPGVATQTFGGYYPIMEIA